MNYGRVSKKNHTQGLATHESRERHLRRISQLESEAQATLKTFTSQKSLQSKKNPQPLKAPRSSALGYAIDDPLPYSSPFQHHHISDTERSFNNINTFAPSDLNDHDPALVVRLVFGFVFPVSLFMNQDFIFDLREFLFSRLAGRPPNELISDEERDSIRICKDHLYRHQVLRVNYTTYDMRRCQDSINPRTHPDVMVHAQEDDPWNYGHPYYYGRILGIYHVWASRCASIGFGPPTPVQRIEFLRVRWFHLDALAPGGLKARRLHRLQFTPFKDPIRAPFGFISPSDVIRAAHIIGAYAHGRTDAFLPPSSARLDTECDEDWVYYYVNM